MFTFLSRICINLLKLLGICLPLEVLGWIILFPVCLLSKSEKLPYLLRYYDNADLYIGRDTSTYLDVIKQGPVARYVWLAFRNPINYFGYMVLGHKVIDNTYGITSGTPNLGDTTGHVEGWQYNTIDDIYEYYLIHKWSATKCLRFRMGWKIGYGPSNPIGSRIQWVLVFQPYKSYTGL